MRRGESQMFKKLNNIQKLFILFFLALSQPAFSCRVDISNFVGYQIIHSGTVTGYIDDNGQEEDSFEGCDYGRILIVDYNLQVTCSGYGYSYAYRPDIVILSGPDGAKACINDQMYDVRI
jgi:hypothetical protein